MKHEKALRDLKAAKGQIESAIRMAEEDRYCIDISKQILATIAHLKKAHNKVLKQHIETCVRDAVETGEVDSKLAELEEVLDYFSKTL
ncbi:MAG: metal-sensitive transcriptional regulator [Thermotogae bacterium]|nr:metal-sensing transcriptional repressor [Thermotogota bacterium]RKX44624.1 MAG: metal-sensitive transcriptional regulator [Thermotogota bacterium]